MFSNVDDSSQIHVINVCNWLLHFGYDWLFWSAFVSPIVGLEEHELAEPSVNEPSSSESLYQEGEGRLLITILKHNTQTQQSITCFIEHIRGFWEIVFT